MRSSRLVRSRKLPAPASFGRGAVLVHDDCLPRRVRGFAAWARRFPACYPVRAGETLKSVEAFPRHVRHLVDLAGGFDRREATLVCAGGGSVGDFGGFAASVLQRGIRLVHVPSTWLAAIDSAHGGKTGLNVAGTKNPLGTFYPAAAVHLVKELLFAQPRARADDGLAELVKMALLAGGPWARRFCRSPLAGPELAWEFLEPAIRAKLQVVRTDPEERSGQRQVLNLGHTLGHVLEAYHGLTHGKAVAQGLFFALEWSRKKAGLPAADAEAFAALVARHTRSRPLATRLPPISRATFLPLLVRDKKSGSGSHVTFVFLRGLGHPLRRRVSHAEVAREAALQGWVG
ncbi:MAG: hypothetical protein JXQ29_06100 [Planctomycetes bacterium]|nr:hypothetical protein [Planctomycetota bacterium]